MPRVKRGFGHARGLSFSIDAEQTRGYNPLLLPAPRSSFSEQHRAVFFAVLEGLYEDGVSDEDVDRILRVDPATKAPRHFVPGCPLCNPALDAFRAYRSRGDWHYKSGGNTFGPGLDESTRRALASEKLGDRFAAVQGLIQRWVSARVRLMRLTNAERKQWNLAIAEMARKGNEILGSMRTFGTAGELGTMKACPICSGAEAGCPAG